MGHFWGICLSLKKVIFLPLLIGGSSPTHFNPINDQQNTCKVFYTALNFDSAADDADITITK